jgi:hypothetical protein
LGKAWSPVAGLVLGGAGMVVLIRVEERRCLGTRRGV